MAIARFLAMTAAEFPQSSPAPAGLAWLACHFSAYGHTLTNLPETLPPGSLLMVDDFHPVQDHDPRQICHQLELCVARFSCAGVLLDFQRPVVAATRNMVCYLEEHLSCPLIVSAPYGATTHGAVCLPPPPCHVSLQEHLAPWQGREIWMELAAEGERLCLTPAGVHILPDSPPAEKAPFREPKLHCHYTIATEETQVCFTLWRTREDLVTLEQEAQALGVTGTLGLWQELGNTSVARTNTSPFGGGSTP